MSGAPTLAPVHATAETTRPRALGGWVAGVVLVAGLALATVIVAGDSNVSVGTLRQIHGESAALRNPNTPKRVEIGTLTPTGSTIRFRGNGPSIRAVELAIEHLLPPLAPPET